MPSVPPGHEMTWNLSYHLLDRFSPLAPPCRSCCERSLLFLCVVPSRQTMSRAESTSASMRRLLPCSSSTRRCPAHASRSSIVKHPIPTWSTGTGWTVSMMCWICLCSSSRVSIAWPSWVITSRRKKRLERISTMWLASGKKRRASRPVWGMRAVPSSRPTGDRHPLSGSMRPMRSFCCHRNDEIMNFARRRDCGACPMLSLSSRREYPTLTCTGPGERSWRYMSSQYFSM
mmetsp:Transcript_24239/g.57779  ORF Transcript_24239/g.57779 Transcript_24239/m.57779 type:complete len:231 (-) Transcript_24239:581-1273(-)